MQALLSILYTHIQLYGETILKIVLAVILGGLIGIERESINRPAGFRTHILVCVGSALVMETSEYIFRAYNGLVNIDPSRLGAQVISGIGFLGAGTIIRDGVTVKGLTTAASLWTVSCIGLTIGAGFYSGAIITSIIVYFVLIYFGDFEVPLIKKNRRNASIKLELIKNEVTFSDIEKLLQENNVVIKGIRYLHQTDDSSIVRLFLSFENSKQYDDIIGIITDVPGVKRVAQY